MMPSAFALIMYRIKADFLLHPQEMEKKSLVVLRTTLL